MISVVIRFSLVQTQTPDQMRGRVSAVSALFTGTSNQLGEFESGLTAALFGAVPAVLIGGIGTEYMGGLEGPPNPPCSDTPRLSRGVPRSP